MLSTICRDNAPFLQAYSLADAGHGADHFIILILRGHKPIDLTDGQDRTASLRFMHVQKNVLQHCANVQGKTCRDNPRRSRTRAQGFNDPYFGTDLRVVPHLPIQTVLSIAEPSTRSSRIICSERRWAPDSTTRPKYPSPTPAQER